MKFIGKNGVLLETDDPIKIDAYRSAGCRELDETPNQANVVVDSEYTVKKVKKGKKKGE